MWSVAVLVVAVGASGAMGWADIGGKFAHIFQTVEEFSPDCHYSEWTQWSPCSAACGVTGFSSRSRVILAEPHGYFGHGSKCDTSSLEEWRDCLGPICDADCVMSEWSQWGACSAACGQGLQARARDILSEPVGNGIACGFTDQTRDCDNGPCAQDCELGQWSCWSDCPACGAGQRQRTRPVIQQAAFGGRSCDAQSLTEFEACNSGPCPQDCVIGQWSFWSECPRCGAGQRSRSRSIVQEAAYGGRSCDESLTEFAACNNGPCAQDCELGQWSCWSDCPACGAGQRQRNRPVIQQAAFGGRSCDAQSLTEFEACNAQPCPQDCIIGQWSFWSECPRCGAGQRSRSRSIVQEAAYGGRSCDESLTEFAACNNSPCPQDCIIGQWSFWSECPACGGGQRQRTRPVIQQAAFGGRSCDAQSLTEFEACNAQPSYIPSRSAPATSYTSSRSAPTTSFTPTRPILTYG